jgi:aspartyl-tRNA(Asn)/glutamyl-tRNA(Gln) amidotransferase subunit B
MHELGGADFFEAMVRREKAPSDKERRQIFSRLAYNWLVNELLGLLREGGEGTPSPSLSMNGEGALEGAGGIGDLPNSPVEPERLAQLVELVEEGELSGKMGKQLLQVMFYEDERTPREIVKARGWAQITDIKEIETLCRRAILDNPVREE